MSEKILFVDDEAPVLEGLQRLLRQEFTVGVAQGGHRGLAALGSSGPYAVVVSDMRMPEMDGVEFLSEVREKWPDTVRILLTGHADLDAAIEAVNRGNIFRFLTKPCKKDVLVEAIHKGLEQYRGAIAQHKLIKKAEMIEHAKSDWDAPDPHEWDNGQGLAGLPGPAEAEAALQPLLGNDRQCYALMVRLTMMQTVEERYGEQAASDYLMGAIQFLVQGLQPEDQFFQWSRNVLMGVLHRQIAPAAVKMGIARLLMNPPQQLVSIGGRKTMLALTTNFDLLPVAQFSSMDEMLTAFKTRSVGLA